MLYFNSVGGEDRAASTLSSAEYAEENARIDPRRKCKLSRLFALLLLLLPLPLLLYCHPKRLLFSNNCPYGMDFAKQVTSGGSICHPERIHYCLGFIA
jgi:hypothetical protein